MDDFVSREGRLCAEEVPVADIAGAVGTPAYVYSRNTLVQHFRRLRDAYAPVQPLIRYALKANDNLAIVKVLADEGAGFDVVSRGEIFRVLKAGGDPAKIDFAGVGKRRDEIEYALDVGIDTFNVESEQELDLIDEVARGRGDVARIALRINPDVDPQTHPYITTGKLENKFGLDVERARRMAESLSEKSGIHLTGLHVHIGSQITRTKPYVEMVGRLLALADDLRGFHPSFESVNIGGGFGIHYHEKEAPEIREFADVLVPLLKDRGYAVHMEPGRLLVGNAGILVTRVLYVKEGNGKRFVICDAAMNDLLRPSLYDAFHRIEPVERRPGREEPADIVGPVCESGDFLAKDRALPPVEPGDLLVVRSAGAYAFVMSSNYNARPRAVEVLVDGSRFGVVRRRETEEDMIRGESSTPEWVE
ncbi:MAG: diaminopimelate decarboxylase [Planctomycetota bacterium]|nr:diaminopimelate decarboxylase [Planctomycetota bacterium]